jgi:hypothetical protein
MTDSHDHHQRCGTCEHAKNKQERIWYYCSETAYQGLAVKRDPADDCLFRPKSRYQPITNPAIFSDEEQMLITNSELTLLTPVINPPLYKTTTEKMQLHAIDTIRSRHFKQPIPDLSHISPDRHGCLDCLNPECTLWQAADQNCWKSQKEYNLDIAAKEREKVKKIIDSGKSALYEIERDGQWNQILQAKMDVLCWIEEELNTPS